MLFSLLFYLQEVQVAVFRSDSVYQSTDEEYLDKGSTSISSLFLSEG